MATFTTRLNLTKPASSENVNVTTQLDNNYDLIDAAVGATVGTLAGRPASAFSGRVYYATDSAKVFVNSASSASTAASWQDPVANTLASSFTIGGSLAASAGSVDVTRSASSSNVQTAKVAGDSQSRYVITADGKNQWGSGAATQDTNLYRSAADTLRTDDAFIAGGGLTSNGAVAASTTLSVGGMLSANGGLTVVGKGQVQYVRKSTTTSRISNTTLTDDPHITFTLAASAVYELRLHLAVSGPAAGDFKTAWNITGGASGGNHTARWAIGPPTTTSDTTATTVKMGRPSLTGSTSYGVDGSATAYITEGALLDTTVGGSGTLTLQWAQNSSVATSTNVTTDSWAMLQRLT